MSYELALLPEAEREWKALDGSVKQIFKKQLQFLAPVPGSTAMSENSLSQQLAAQDPATLPFVAPCRELAASAPLRWVRLGWQDFRRAPRQSLGYGVAVVLLS